MPVNTERYRADKVLIYENKIASFSPEMSYTKLCSLQIFINIYPSVGLHECSFSEEIYFFIQTTNWNILYQHQISGGKIWIPMLMEYIPNMHTFMHDLQATLQ